MLVKHRGSEKAEERIFLRNTRQLYAQALKETTGMRYPAADSQTTGIGQAEQTMQTGKQWTEREPRSMEEYRDYVEEMYRNGDMDEETYEQKLEMFHQMEETGELKKKFSYTNNFIYTIDRWQTGDSGSAIELQNDGVKLYSSDGSQNFYIFQRVKKMCAGTYTFAAKFHGNTGIAAISSYATDNLGYIAPTSADENGVLILSFIITEDIDAECEK